eukprot:1801227-Pleurochrysis_carterae.AAC.1
MNVPGTPTIDYETDAALTVPQVSTTFGRIASRACGNRDASGGRDRSGALADSRNHCHSRFDISSTSGAGARGARAIMRDIVELRRTFREETVQKGAMHCFVELEE